MRTKTFFLAINLLVVNLIGAQNIIGTIVNHDKEPLFGATILWQGTDLGAVADENGNFELPKQKKAANLLIRYVGYDPLFIEVLPAEDTVYIEIDGISDLLEIEVAAKIRDNYTSTLESLNIESISSNELKKAACCSLAESFETNASVDVSYTDAVTGAREIHMLGLRGLYVQMLIEKRPALAGLGAPLGMEFLPGTWLQGIQISKGTGSVQNGYQAVVGQINSDLKKPFQDKKVFVNLFGTPLGRFEANVHLNKKINEQWSTGVLLHGNYFQNEFDRNGDSFMDMPMKKQLNGMYRLFYRGVNLRSQFNVHALTDERQGGQIFNDQIPQGTELYTIYQRNRRVEAFGKAGYLGFDRPETSVGFIYNASWHRLDNSYGRTKHTGTQKDAYANLIYSSFLGTTENKINAGISYLYEDYEEKLNDSDFSRIESVPGIFAEYSLVHAGTDFGTLGEKIGIVAGARLDKHNQFGWLFTPRVNFKFNFSEESVIRLAAGKGFRTPNVIAENVSVLASSRIVDVMDDLDMEEAWNFGINFTQNFNLGTRDASISADLYRTQFKNQVVMDMETDRQKVLYYNLDGESFSNSFLTMFSYELLEKVNMKVAYKFNDVKTTYNGDLRQRPLIAKHKGLATLDYESKDENWMISSSLQLVGNQRFPDNSSVPLDIRQYHEGFSPAYATVNAQLTRKFGNLEIYIGGENLTNYKQENPIIDWENPFGDYFDATQVYAPIFGARGYIGLRWGIE
ncbi:MAG: TonB-dependent receptor [Bacteroidetes bacterium]|nr:TonB-dependent receptor [Bacteroidota bacterium]